MYGMKIGEFHSYKDFGLVPTSKPVINLAQPKLEYIEIPAIHGEIDISESLVGEVMYQMREGSFEFMVLDSKRWEDVYKKLISKVHGQKINLILDTEKEYIYQGRMWVSQFKSSKNYSLITLDYKFYPYKYSVFDLKDNGEIMYSINGIVIKDNKSVNLTFDSDMSIVPEFNNKTENILTLNFDGKNFMIPKGKSRFPEIRGRKNLVLNFRGNSIVDISYKRGWL